MADEFHDWYARWLDPVASNPNSMSQRSKASIDKHGGVGRAIRAARERGIHLCQIVDDRGRPLIAATDKPIVTLC